MAIDTAAKRGSAICVSMPWRPFLPLPDGVIDQGDRQAVPFMYSGILAANPAPVVTKARNHPFFATQTQLMHR